MLGQTSSGAPPNATVSYMLDSPEAERVGLPQWVADALSGVDFTAVGNDLQKLALSREFRSGKGQPQFEAAVATSIGQNLASLRRLLTGAATLADVDPIEPVAMAVLVARLEISQASLHRAWRMAVDTVWKFGVEAICDHARLADLRGADVVDGIVAFTTLLERFHGRYVAVTAAAHRQEEDAMRASNQLFRRRAIRELLAGKTAMLVDDLGGVLNYDVQFTHLAVLFSHSREEVAEPVVTELADVLGADATLAFAPGLDSAVYWLGRRSPWPAPWRQTAKDVLCRAGMTAAVSEPAPGLRGLSASFEQTRRVETVRRLTTAALPPVLLFRDMRLEAQLLHDVDAACAFVDVELAGLAGRSKMHAGLRETVELWLENRSVVETAKGLALHEHTVRNRLRHAEALLGKQLTERPAEIQAALRLHRIA